MIEGVILIGVGRNLNRAVRTCYTFGIYNIYCFNCNTATLHGNLFSASSRVRLHELADLTKINPRALLAVEANRKLPSLRKISKEKIKYVAVGGESTTLRQKDFPVMAYIPTRNRLCLTTEAALAIVLYEFSQEGLL
ncbi:MAG: hypothetical protein JRC86_10310 [Deltaproteobacteria bacterium]|nr:hypothetical protein [Deltaproteobacteria bacterium]